MIDKILKNTIIQYTLDLYSAHMTVYYYSKQVPKAALTFYEFLIFKDLLLPGQ